MHAHVGKTHKRSVLCGAAFIAIMIRDKDYSLQTCQQFIFVNQASCYMKKDTYEHTGETTCAVNVEKKPFCEVYPTS